MIVDRDGERALDLWNAGSLDAQTAQEVLLGLMMAFDGMSVVEMASARLGANPDILQGALHRVIYRAILDVAGRGLLPDPMTVDAELRRRNIPDYSIGDLSELLTRVMDLTNIAATSQVVEGLCQAVLDAAGRRYLLAVSQKLATAAVDGTPVAEAQERAIQAIGKAPRPTLGADTTISAAAENYRQQLDAWRESPGILRGTTTGLANLDRVTHGWRPGQLIVLAARMSMGKSAYALSFTLAAARAIMESTDGGHDHQVGFISLEMDERSLMHRLVAASAGIDGDKMVEGDPSLDWDAIEEARVALSLMPIRLVDAHGANNRANGQHGAMTVDAIREYALSWHREGRLDLLVIDFLSCIVAPKELRRESYERQIAYHVQALKNLASELQIPVMLLVQLNRDNEKSGNPVPQLHHLRDSDAIGQFADLVVFPVRWDYYRERGMSVPDEVKSRPKGFTSLYIQKQRMGRVGAVQAWSDMASNRIYEWSGMRNAPVDEYGLLRGWRPEFWPEGEGR